MDSLSAINQDYAWGQDSRADFVAAAQQLYPNVKVQTDLLPKFGAGQYGTEISALVGAGSDVVYSSLWGGDLQAFVLQSAPRGLPKRSQLVFSAAERHGYDVSALSVTEPTLETVFINLTGKDLRE